MFRGLLVLLLLATASCNPPDQLLVGTCPISGKELDAAVHNLEQSFPQFGPDTLVWRLLDDGLGPAALLHAALPRQSVRAKALAQQWADRIHQGESIQDLAREIRNLTPSADPAQDPRAPSPNSLGAATAAATAALQPGEWSGPYRSRLGWEVLALLHREEGPSSRAWVTLVRLTAPVGDADDLAAARRGWQELPLAGSPERLRSLPAWFRLDRIASPAK